METKHYDFISIGDTVTDASIRINQASTIDEGNKRGDDFLLGACL